MIFRDTVYAHGAFHDLTIECDTPRFTIDGTGYQADQPLIAGRLALDGTGRAYAVLFTYQDYALVFDGASFRPIPHNGRGSCGLFPLETDCEIHAMGYNDGDRMTVTVYRASDLDAPPRFYSWVYGTIYYVTGPETLITDKDAFTGEVSGVPVWRIAGPETARRVGVTSLTPPGAKDGTAVLVMADGEVLLAQPTPTWNCETNLQPYVAESPSGEVRVALQDSNPGNQAPAPDEIQWVRQGQAPPVDPPVPPDATVHKLTIPNFKAGDTVILYTLSGNR